MDEERNHVRHVRICCADASVGGAMCDFFKSILCGVRCWGDAAVAINLFQLMFPRCVRWPRLKKLCIEMHVTGCDAELARKGMCHMLPLQILRMLHTFCLIFSVATVSPILAIPTAEELAEVKPLVAELIKPDMDAMRAGKKSKSDAAKASLSLASQAETPAAKLLLTRNAFQLYMKGGDYDAAAAALDAMLAAVPDYPADELQELIEKALYPVPSKKAPHIRARVAALKQKATAATQLKKILALLEKTPDDPALNLRLGKVYALQNDWKRALPALAKGSNAALAKAAKAELDLEISPAKAADLYWSVELPKKDAALVSATRTHAAELYKSALPDLTGLAKVQAERRVKEAVSQNVPVEKESVSKGNSGASEWVYCSGGSFYLDTGITPKSTMTIEWDVRFPAAYKGNHNFSGANAAGKGMCINTGTKNTSMMEFYDEKWQGGADAAKCLVMDSAQRNLIVWNATGISVNGRLVVKSPLQNCSDSLVLFDRNRGGKPGGSSTECWVYGVKIRDGNRVLLDYRPKVKGGVAGFADKVSGRFVSPAVGLLKFGKD